MSETSLASDNSFSGNSMNGVSVLPRAEQLKRNKQELEANEAKLLKNPILIASQQFNKLENALFKLGEKIDDNRSQLALAENNEDRELIMQKGIQLTRDFYSTRTQQKLSTVRNRASVERQISELLDSPDMKQLAKDLAKAVNPEQKVSSKETPQLLMALLPYLVRLSVMPLIEEYSNESIRTSLVQNLRIICEIVGMYEDMRESKAINAVLLVLKKFYKNTNVVSILRDLNISMSQTFDSEALQHAQDQLKEIRSKKSFIVDMLKRAGMEVDGQDELDINELHRNIQQAFSMDRIYVVGMDAQQPFMTLEEVKKNKNSIAFSKDSLVYRLAYAGERAQLRQLMDLVKSRISIESKYTEHPKIAEFYYDGFYYLPPGLYMNGKKVYAKGVKKVSGGKATNVETNGMGNLPAGKYLRVKPGSDTFYDFLTSDTGAKIIRLKQTQALESEQVKERPDRTTKAVGFTQVIRDRREFLSAQEARMSGALETPMAARLPKSSSRRAQQRQATKEIYIPVLHSQVYNAVSNRDINGFTTRQGIRYAGELIVPSEMMALAKAGPSDDIRYLKSNLGNYVRVKEEDGTMYVYNGMSDMWLDINVYRNDNALLEKTPEMQNRLFAITRDNSHFHALTSAQISSIWNSPLLSFDGGIEMIPMRNTLENCIVLVSNMTHWELHELVYTHDLLRQNAELSLQVSDYSVPSPSEVETLVSLANQAQRERFAKFAQVSANVKGKMSETVKRGLDAYFSSETPQEERERIARSLRFNTRDIINYVNGNVQVFSPQNVNYDAVRILDKLVATNAASMRHNRMRQVSEIIDSAVRVNTLVESDTDYIREVKLALQKYWKALQNLVSRNDDIVRSLMALQDYIGRTHRFSYVVVDIIAHMLQTIPGKSDDRVILQCDGSLLWGSIDTLTPQYTSHLAVHVTQSNYYMILNAETLPRMRKMEFDFDKYSPAEMAAAAALGMPVDSAYRIYYKVILSRSLRETAPDFEEFAKDTDLEYYSEASPTQKGPSPRRIETSFTFTG